MSTFVSPDGKVWCNVPRDDVNSSSLSTWPASSTADFPVSRWLSHRRAGA